MSSINIQKEDSDEKSKSIDESLTDIIDKYTSNDTQETEEEKD